MASGMLELRRARARREPFWPVLIRSLFLPSSYPPC